MLALSQHNASLSNLNVRIERHGEDRQLAADLKLTCNVAGVVLNDIEQGLHDSLFRMPASSGEQPDLIDPALLTAVKFPHLQPVVLNHKFPGYEADFGSDVDDYPLFLADLELKKITAKPIEGGSAEISFTLSGNIDTDDVAHLAELLVREDVVLSIKPPARPQPAEDLSSDAANDADGAQGEAA